MDHASTPKSGGTTLTGFAKCLQHLRVLAALCVGIVLIMSGESQKVSPFLWAAIVHLPVCIGKYLSRMIRSVRHAGLVLTQPIDVCLNSGIVPGHRHLLIHSHVHRLPQICFLRHEKCLCLDPHDREPLWKGRYAARRPSSLFLAACIPFIQCHNVFRAVLASWQAANREHVTAVNEVRTATQELHNLQKQVRQALSVLS
jgi:hypothetical protein